MRSFIVLICLSLSACGGAGSPTAPKSPFVFQTATANVFSACGVLVTASGGFGQANGQTLVNGQVYRGNDVYLDSETRLTCEYSLAAGVPYFVRSVPTL